MSSESVKPADVLVRVDEVLALILWLARLVYALTALVLIQIGAKWVLYVRISRQMDKTDRLLALAEKHGAINDSVVTEIKEKTEEARVSLSEQVKKESAKLAAKLPTLTAEKVVSISQSGDSGANIPRPSAEDASIFGAPPDTNDPRN